MMRHTPEITVVPIFLPSNDDPPPVSGSKGESGETGVNVGPFPSVDPGVARKRLSPPQRQKGYREPISSR